MENDQLRYLVALAQKSDIDLAAARCDVTAADIAAAVSAAEEMFGRRVLKLGSASAGFSGFTEDGERVVDWARRYLDDYDGLQRRVGRTKKKALLKPLLERRSISPKRLIGPGPDADDIGLILQGALRSPDHGGLHPWRVVEFHVAQREALADQFEQEKRRRDPLASVRDLQLAREHATRPPVLLAFVVSPQARSKVPVREQWLSAGAALGNLLNAAHQLGFGAIVLSGERCFDPILSHELGLASEEFLAGFISMGTVADAPPPKAHAQPSAVLSTWQPPSENGLSLNSRHTSPPLSRM